MSDLNRAMLTLDHEWRICSTFNAGKVKALVGVLLEENEGELYT